MNDLERAKQSLDGHTIALCKGENILISDKKGVSPMIEFIDSGIDLNGYSVADLIVGKAVAMLDLKAGIVAVYAKTISKSAVQFLSEHNIPFCFEILADKIINRKGDDICPMEKVVMNTEDYEEGYVLIKDKLIQLKNAKTV